MIIDDLLSKSHMKLLQDTFVDTTIDYWTYLVDTSGHETDGEPYTESFAFCPFWDEYGGVQLQGVYQFLVVPLLVALDKRDQELIQLHRIRVGMLTRTPHQVVHQKHLDMPQAIDKKKTRTGLFYLNDSDGPTRLYDGDIVTQEIEPVANRWTDMDGDVYHASSTPTEHRNRLIVNYNYTIK